MWWLWAVAAVVVVYGVVIRQHLYRRRHPPVDAPRNVHLHYDNGQTVPVDLLYRGRLGRVHHWWAVSSVTLTPGREVTVCADYMPANTVLHGKFRAPAGTWVTFGEDPRT